MLDPNHTPLDIRAVIFDYGQVLCLEPTPEAMEQMSGFFHLTPDQFRPLYDSSRLAYDHGDFTPTSSWSCFSEHAGFVFGPSQSQAFRKCVLESRVGSNQPCVWGMSGF